MSQQRPARRRRGRQPDNTARLTATVVGAILAGATRAIIAWLLEYLSTGR